MIPNMMNFGMPQLSMPVAGDQLKSVNGIEGAKQFPVSANSRVALFDMNEDIVYIKTVDAGGYPSIRTFRMVEENSAPKEPQYVTMEEFMKFKEELLNGKQSVPESTGTAG
jgi:hypothetical protein